MQSALLEQLWQCSNFIG